jgi:hypothetical protein
MPEKAGINKPALYFTHNPMRQRSHPNENILLVRAVFLGVHSCGWWFAKQ